MDAKGRFPNVIFGATLRPESATLAILVLLLFLLFVLLFLTFTAQPVQGQSYNVIHYFSGGDGAFPAGVAVGAAGDIYGSTEYGGSGNCRFYNYVGCGTVFRLANRGSGWVLNPLHVFTAQPDGAYPGRITLAPDGTVYGSTIVGGDSNAGVFYNLKPSATACRTALCTWTETQLYSFKGCFVDAYGGSQLVFDSTHNLYGTSWGCGIYGGGTVYRLTPSSGAWTESVLYNFEGLDGYNPVAVLPDGAGNLFGMTFTYATVFELKPAGGSWSKTVLHQFQDNEGCDPASGLILDSSGSLYGATSFCGMLGGGSVFKLSPSGGGWSFSTLYNMPGDGTTTNGNLVMDAGGNLYGTTLSGGSHGQGSVFKLTPGDQGWTYSSLHDFTGGPNDGALPGDGVTLAPNGKIYGTTASGGLQLCYDINGNPGCGVVFEIAP